MGEVATIRKGSGFNLQPANLDQAMQIASMLANSSMVPKDYKGRKEDTLVAMMMGSELGLNPIQSLQNIAVINGRPSIYGDAMLALVQNHPAFGGIEEVFDEASMTATCITWRKGGPKHKQTFSKKDAELAGLWGKGGPWKQYAKRMLQMRARGFSLRDTFADALAGLITVEEARDIPNEETREEIDVTPAPEEPTMYPEESFKKNFPTWKEAIQKKGPGSAERLIAMIQSKGALTEEQIQALKDCEGESNGNS